MNQGLIEFNGHSIKYPNGYTIHINLDDVDHSYTFDVFDNNGECVCVSMCLIHQAHELAVQGNKDGRV